MSRLRCSVNVTRDVLALVHNRKAFAFLIDRQPLLSAASIWQRDDGDSHDVQVIAIGKTGYGKSTTLNQLVGEEVFETNDIHGCTRVMQSAEYRFQTAKGQYYFSLADLPGIGETPELDKQYIVLYRQAIQTAHVVIYLLRADQRDYSNDLWAFSELFRTSFERRKVILVINAVDKIEPLNRCLPFELSWEQMQSLELKLTQLSAKFNIPEDRIVAVSATEQFNLDKLTHKLAEHLLPFLQLTQKDM
jgi:small GTP-binding protein